MGFSTALMHDMKPKTALLYFQLIYIYAFGIVDIHTTLLYFLLLTIAIQSTMEPINKRRLEHTATEQYSVHKKDNSSLKKKSTISCFNFRSPHPRQRHHELLNLARRRYRYRNRSIQYTLSLCGRPTVQARGGPTVQAARVEGE
jgi:hypothetical protein